MRLTADVALVGSGSYGFDLSSPADAHTYLIDGDDELALVDAGAGGTVGNTDLILRNIAADGFDTNHISRLLITHYHLDHIGAAAEMRERLGLTVHASPLTAHTLETGNEIVVCLDALKAIGFMPADYRFRACPAVGDLVEGATFPIGRLTVTVFETPGHCNGHVSLLVTGGDRPTLIQGDLVFFGGTISLQNVPDCSVELYGESVRKLAAVDFEAFLPGHGPISLRNGKRHVESAAAQFAQLGVPRNFA